MGRLALGAALRSFTGASVVLLSVGSALAQVPVAGAGPRPAPQPPSVAQPEPLPPAPAAPAPVPSAPAPAPAAPAAPAPIPAPPPPPPEPPLDLPKSEPKRPAFLHTREEMERIKPSRARREAPEHVEPAAPKAVPKDFLLNSSPWVDFTLTSFYMENRVGNFLNLGVQFGGYLWQRLRVSGRMVVPLEDVNDDLSSSYSNTDIGGTGSYRRRDARSMSALYGASVGLLITNSKSFVFGPSIELQRTDVSAYGTAVAFGMPFEWTTQKNLRIGFELAIGHGFGGSTPQVCQAFGSPSTSCGDRTHDRPSGMTVLFQYNMGWGLGDF